MKKENLLKKKKRIVANLRNYSKSWYIIDALTEEDLKYFSINQLMRIGSISQRAEKIRSNTCSFEEISATEIFHKPTKKFFAINGENEICEKTLIYMSEGASCECEIVKKGGRI